MTKWENGGSYRHARANIPFTILRAIDLNQLFADACLISLDKAD